MEERWRQQREAERAAARERQRNRRLNLREDERQAIRIRNRLRMQLQMGNMDVQERQQHLENEHEIPVYYIGRMDVRCRFCGALRFQREQLNCCHNGKVSLPPLQEYPENLRLLFDADNAEGSNFSQNIRKYNSAFAFASFGANIRPPPGCSYPFPRLTRDVLIRLG